MYGLKERVIKEFKTGIGIKRIIRKIKTLIVIAIKREESWKTLNDKIMASIRRKGGKSNRRSSRGRNRTYEIFYLNEIIYNYYKLNLFNVKSVKLFI